MTKDEFKLIVKGLKAVYTDPKFMPDNVSFDVWYSLLKDMDYKICSLATQRYMSTCKFPPTPADIRQQAADMAASDLTPLEAWAVVLKAIRTMQVDGEKESFAALPDECKRAVGSPANLKNWAFYTDRDTLNSVEQSHFIGSYKAVCKQKHDDAQIPQRIRDMIDQTASRMIGESNT